MIRGDDLELRRQRGERRRSIMEPLRAVKKEQFLALALAPQMELAAANFDVGLLHQPFLSSRTASAAAACS